MLTLCFNIVIIEEVTMENTNNQSLSTVDSSQPAHYIEGESSGADFDSPETSEKKRRAGLWIGVGATAGAVVIAGAGILAGIGSGDSESSSEAINNDITTSAPANPGESVSSESDIITGSTPEYLSVYELIERPMIRGLSTEELLVEHSPPKNLSDVEEITRNWTYNLGLYENLGRGKDNGKIALFDSPESPLWGGDIDKFVTGSKEIGKVRVFEDREDYWAAYSFDIDSYSIDSNDAFTFSGAMVAEVTNGDRNITEGLFVMRYSQFTANGKTYSGWQLSQNIP